MKKRLWILCLMCVLLCALSVSALAETYDTSNITNSTPGTTGGTYTVGTTTNNDNSNNSNVVTPSTNNLPDPDTCTHRWGEYQVKVEATCAKPGSKTRRCGICGKTETVTIPMKDHVWGKWNVSKAATCTKDGKDQRMCSECGRVSSRITKKLGHDIHDWEVSTEPTCLKPGKESGVCTRCNKKITQQIPKIDHEYEEWETVLEPTDFSKGKREAVCRFCKRKKTEEFYPEGTLAPSLPNSADEVEALQKELTGLGFHKGKITGTYDKTTIASVKKAQKKLGVKQDGIAWPGVLKLLGLFRSGLGEPVSDFTSKDKLKLEAVQTSAKKDYYEVGDTLTFTWTLSNLSVKNDAKNMKVYFFEGVKPSKKTDQEIDQPGEVKKGASASGVYTYTVTKQDALKGKFSLGFIARGKLGGSNMESNKVVFVNAATTGKGGTGGWTPPSELSLDLTKKVANSPKKGSFFVKGEKIRFEISVANKTAKGVESVIVTDKLLGDTWKKTLPELGAGVTKKYEAEYTVTAKDLAAGEITNTAIVSYTGEDGKQKTAKATVKAPVGLDPDGLYVYKTTTSTPANKKFYLPDETVIYKIVIENPTSRTFSSLRVYEMLESKTDAYKTYSTLKPGQKVEFSYAAKVTKLDGKLKKKTNIVKVTYRDPDKKDRTSVSNECTVPCGLPGDDGIIVEKKVISAPANGKYYKEGEEVRYEIDVTNNTERDIIDMSIRDSLADLDTKGYRTIHEGEKLAAGKTFSTHFTWVVTEDDVDNTIVTNIASAVWAMDKDEYSETFSDPVIVPTKEVPGSRKAKFKKLGGDACENVLTAVGDGVTQRDLTECEDHTETAEQSGILTESGDYDKAVELWDVDLDRLYGEWKESGDGETRRIAENEWAAFNRQVTAFEKSMSLVADEKEVNIIAVEERMNKVVGLCYELHTAPEERADSLNGRQASLDKTNSGTECTHTATYDAKGAARFVDDQCENHTLTNQLTEYLLSMATDEEEKTAAWLRIQGNWLLELDSMYDTWYLSADEEKRAVIAADRMAFDELITARRAALEELYPDEPATAAEVLSNMIMDRTETVCRVLHDAGVLKD